MPGAARASREASMDGERLVDARARADVLASVDGGEFDLVVVGGGINGAGIFRDAAMRGLRVLLLEQRDFAFGTSSRSSKLIHGGLRYLEHYQFKLVFEGTNERAALRKIAPHLVRPAPFALPVYEGDKHPLWMMDVGLWMYDTLSLFKVWKRHVTLRSPKRLLEREPMLRAEGLTGGIIYYDCITDDARLTLENVLDGCWMGAPALSGAEVERIDGAEDPKRLAEVHFRDVDSGQSFRVSAKAVVNATGAWTDRTRGLAQIDGEVVRPTKGVHLVFSQERLSLRHAVALVAPQDGRVYFGIPWRDRTVVGTTDTDDNSDPSALAVTPEDVRYLLDATNHAFPAAEVTEADVLASWVGLRPLIRPEDGVDSASDVPREHRLFTDGRMVTVAGGKLTTYRRMAAEVVDCAVEAVGLDAGRAQTQRAPLVGARGLEGGFSVWRDAFIDRVDLPGDVAGYLADVYGSRAELVADIAAEDPSMAERICPDRPNIYAEVEFAVAHDLARTVDDVMVRRTSLALTAEGRGWPAVDRVADLMARKLGWSPKRRAESVAEFERSLALTAVSGGV